MKPLAAAHSLLMSDDISCNIKEVGLYMISTTPRYRIRAGRQRSGTNGLSGCRLRSRLPHPLRRNVLFSWLAPHHAAPDIAIVSRVCISIVPIVQCKGQLYCCTFVPVTNPLCRHFPVMLDACPIGHFGFRLSSNVRFVPWKHHIVTACKPLLLLHLLSCNSPDRADTSVGPINSACHADERKPQGQQQRCCCH